MKLFILAAVCFLPGVASAADPSALEILKRALAPEAPAYEGRVVVDGKRMKVHFQPPSRYRRELLDENGKTAQLVVSDGKTEWIYDKKNRKVWQGEPADPSAKKLKPDEEYELLKANYEVAAAPGDKIARRATWLLSLSSRFDRAVKRRLWVDRKTGLVLRRESVGADGTVASDMSFETVLFPKREQAAHFFEFAPPRGATVVRRADPDFKALGEAKAASGLEPRTPAWLPSGFVFESLDVLPRGGQRVIHYRYSDGMSALSLFQSPLGVKLDFGAAQGRTAKLSFGTATQARTREGSVLAWTSGRSRFLLVGPVAPEALERVAGSIR